MATINVNLTNEYQEIIVGASGYIIIQASQSVQIHIDAAAKPANDAPGIQLRPGKDGTAFAGAGLAGKKVWAKGGAGYTAGGSIVVATW